MLSRSVDWQNKVPRPPVFPLYLTAGTPALRDFPRLSGRLGGLIEAPEPTMTARIYKPAKNAMQSGQANTHSWILDFEPEVPRQVEPLMGWTSSFDTRQQLRLHFGSK